MKEFDLSGTFASKVIRWCADYLNREAPETVCDATSLLIWTSLSLIWVLVVSGMLITAEVWYLLEFFQSITLSRIYPIQDSSALNLLFLVFTSLHIVALVIWAVINHEPREKPEKKERTPSFISLAYTSLKEKTCFKIKL